MDFLKKCKVDGLKKTDQGKSGLIFVKDNVCKEQSFAFDKVDKSIIRSEQQFDAIFADAGYTVIKKFDEENMPGEIVPIICYILKPNDDV